MSVQSGGEILGAGTLSSGGVTVTGGTLTPGASAGTLSLDGDLSTDTDTVFDFELEGTDTTAGSNVNDLIDSIVNLELNGTLNVTELTADSFLSGELGDTWQLLGYSGALSGSGLTLGSMPALSSPDYAFALDTGTAGQINLTIIPEPASLGLLLLGCAALANRRRRA